MKALLQRFGIQPEERALIGWAGLSLTLLGSSAIALMNTAETLFLKRVGVEQLPVALLVSAGLLVATTSTAGRLASEAPARWLPRILLALALAPLPFVALVEASSPLVLGVLLLVSRQLLAIGALAFWMAMGSLVPARRAKVIFAPLGAGLTVGGIAGSFASEPLARVAGIDGLIGLCAAGLGAAALAGIPLRRLGTRELDAAGRAPSAPTRVEGGVFSLLRTSRLFRLLAIALFCGGILSPILYFEFASVLDAATQGPGGEQLMLDLYSRFRGWMNVAMLVTQLWLSGFLYRHIGLPLAMATWPAAYVLGLGWLGIDFALVAALTSWGLAQVSEDGISDSATRVLYNLFPDSIQNQATGLLEGPIYRLGGLLGNASLIGAIALEAAGWVIWAGLAIGIVWLASGLVLWRAYPSLLLRASAEHGLRGAGVDRAVLLDPSTLRSLAANLIDPDLRISRAAVDLVVDADPGRALPLLAEALRSAPEGNRPVLVGALRQVASRWQPGDSGAERASAALSDCLQTDPPFVAEERVEIVRVDSRLTRDREAAWPASRERLARLLGDRAAIVRLAAIVELSRRGTPPPGLPDLDRTLSDALAARDPLLRRAARQELRALLGDAAVDDTWSRRLALLAGHLDQRADRAETAEVLCDVARRHGADMADLADDALRFADDRDPRVRGAVLAMAGHAGRIETAPRLVAELGSAQPEAVAGAREGLVALGADAVLPLLVGLELGGALRREAALHVLGELEVEASTLEALCARQVDEVRDSVRHRAALDPGAGLCAALLARRLEERVDEGIGALLGLLSVLREEPRLSDLERRLRRCRDDGERDLLVEAVEALLARRDREALLPLLETTDWNRRGEAAAKALGRALPEPPGLLAELRESVDATTRALAESLMLDGRDGIGDAPEMPNAMQVAAQLQEVQPFDRLGTQQLLSLVELMQEQKAAAGEQICAAGEEGLGLYLVLSGEVELRRGGVTLECAGPGSFFGELSTLDGVPRSTDAVARSEASLMRLDREDALRLLDEAPGFALGLAQALSARLRRLEDRFVDSVRGSSE